MAVSAARQHGFLEDFEAKEAQLRRSMPALLAEGRRRPRPVRGAPERRRWIASAAARASEAALQRSQTIVRSIQSEPWPSEVISGDDYLFDEEVLPVFGPDPPVGDAAVRHLLGGDLYTPAKARMERAREVARSIRAQEPADPNAARVSPTRRAANIVQQVDRDLATARGARRGRTSRPHLDPHVRETIIRDLLEQEATGRGALEELKERTESVTADMHRLHADLESRRPYLTQMTSADWDSQELPADGAPSDTDKR